MAKSSTKKTGVAFSGGGVRSAALCSGVLRRLLQKGVSIDYLSCVSGGGYTGASYMDWKFNNGRKDDPAWHKEYFEHLRKHINHLCHCNNPCHGFIDAIVLVVFTLFFSLGIMAIGAISFVIPTSFLVDYCIGGLLRAQFTCQQENTNKTVEGISKDELRNSCVPMFGPKMEELYSVFLGMLAVFVLSYYLSTLPWRRTFKYFFTFLYRLSGFALAMIFLPWFIEMYSSFTPRWSRYFIIALVALVWVAFPSLRNRASMCLLVLVFAYFITWRVFKTPLFGFHYSYDRFWIMMCISGILLWIRPYLGIIQIYAVHLFMEWRLHRAYFFAHKNGKTMCSCCQPREGSVGKHLTLADLAGMQPELQCNVTVHRWRKTDAKTEKDYEVLTLSPKLIERIDRGQEEREFGYEGFIRPMDIRLSSAMATSAAAVSHDLGDYEASQLLGFRELRVVLGLGYGNYVVAQPGLTNTCMSWVLTFIIQSCFGTILFGLPLALYLGVFKDLEFWERLGLIAFLSLLVLLAVLAVLPTGSSYKRCEGFIRWCIINILHVRLLRILLGVTNVGPVPPPFMSLSDGAHVENLGLLPLLKQRLSRIIVVNGGALESGTYATDLLLTLQQARVKLRCSFTGVSGRDIHEDIRQEFVEKPSGNQPRSYRFKVTYYEKSGFEEKVVGEGEVILLMPRHPDDGISQFEDCKWIDLDDDVKLDLDESAWGPGPYLKASEVDRLTGCCCECCHCTPLCCVHNPLCGRFPFHSIVNQMFTASQFNAYHREGYRACLEAEADEFLGTHENEDEVVVDQPQVSPVTAKTIHVANID